MIQEAYCSFEVAKLLKEKGFDEYCYMHYEKDGSQYISDCEVNNSQFDKEPGNCISTPTHQMAMAWLREKKYISIVIDDDEIPLSYKYIIKKYSINDKYKVVVLKLDSSPFIKYEMAVEAALKYTLENLI